jgi:hypoxia induced protein
LRPCMLAGFDAKVARFAPLSGAVPRRLSMGSGSFLITLATAAVAIVLVLGLANMLRGGSPNRSQNLMRLRVVLQAVAILLILLVLWWRGH